MCLIVFAYRYSPGLPLVVAANRDEFHARPTRAARFWTSDQHHGDLLAGQDLVQGGTWLGLTRGGRFAAVTNIRNPGTAQGSRSRGLLTSNFLTSQQPAADYLRQLQNSLQDYAGFNLLLGDQQGLYYLDSNTGQILELHPGIYGLSNATLDSDWPKVNHGKSAIRNLLDNNDVSIDALTSIMMDREPAPDWQLPDTGIPRELERQLSASFIVDHERDYGTRCTTAIVIDAQSTVRFSEQNYDAGTGIVARQVFNFPLLIPQSQVP
jgi:uncharacterized protein with NRDE domain